MGDARIELTDLRRLTRDDIPWETEALARALIGAVLVRRCPDGALVGGRIVETEAYLPGDPASHAFRGPTARNASMFVEPLHAYVYFIYGTAYCLNVTSEQCGVGAAVLIRALEPLGELERLRARRGATVADRDLLRGPGRLCAALDIDRQLDGADLETDPRLWIAASAEPAPAIAASARIGITKAADVAHRFYARGSRYVSGSRRLSAAE